jgi:hypothetical protein
MNKQKRVLIQCRLLLLGMVALLLSRCAKEITISPAQSGQFVKFYGGGLLDNGQQVIETADSGFVILSTLSNPGQSTDMAFIQVDKYGNTRQAPRMFGGALADQGAALSELEDGGYLLVGTLGVSILAGEMDRDFLIVKLNERGEPEWEKNYGGRGNQEAHAVTRTVDGGFLVVGSTDYSPLEADRNVKKLIYLLKLSEQGDSLWSRIYGFAGENFATSVLQRDNGDFLILGTTTRSENNQAGYNIILMQTNANGLINAGYVTLGGMADDYSGQLLAEPGGLVVAGLTSNIFTGKQEFILYFLNSSLVVTQSKSYSSKGNVTGGWVIPYESGYLVVTNEEPTENLSSIFINQVTRQLEVQFIDSIETTADQQSSGFLISRDKRMVLTGSNKVGGLSRVLLVKQALP